MNKLPWLLAGVCSGHHAATSGTKVLRKVDRPESERSGIADKDL